MKTFSTWLSLVLFAVVAVANPALAQLGVGATASIKNTIETSEVRGYTTASLYGAGRIYGNWKEITESNLLVGDAGKLYVGVVFDTNKGKGVDRAWWTFDARARDKDAHKDPKKCKYWSPMELIGGQWYVVIDLAKPFCNPDGSPILSEGSTPWIPGLPLVVRFLGNIVDGKESSTRFIFVKHGAYADITRASHIQISQTSLRDDEGRLLPQYGETLRPEGVERLNTLAILDRLAADGSGVRPSIETVRKVLVGTSGGAPQESSNVTPPVTGGIRKVKVIVEGFGQPLIVKLQCDGVDTEEVEITTFEEFAIDESARKGFTVWAKLPGGSFVQVRNVQTGDYSPYTLPTPGETRPLTLRPRAKSTR
jgi:hypothetical protein